jgi:hypothetical protein
MAGMIQTPSFDHWQDAGHKIVSGRLRRSRKMASSARKIVSLEEDEETNSHDCEGALRSERAEGNKRGRIAIVARCPRRLSCAFWHLRFWRSGRSE